MSRSNTTTTTATTSTKKKRSDSSLALRNQLKESFVIVPDIKNTVSLLSYIQLARHLYYSSIDASKKGDLRRAYIDLYKFQRLVLEKIPTHIDYRSNSSKLHDDKRWLEQIKATAMHSLELVVQNLDNEEDIRLLHVDDYNLIDEFDSIDINNNNNINSNNNNYKSSPTIINSSISSTNYDYITSSPFDTNPFLIPTLPAASSMAAVSVPVSSNIPNIYNDTTTDHSLTSVTNATTSVIEQPHSISSLSSASSVSIPPTINKSNIVKPTERRDLSRISNIFNTSTHSSNISSTDNISPTISTNYPIITISTESNNSNNDYYNNHYNNNNSISSINNNNNTIFNIGNTSSSNFLGEIEWEIISKLGPSLTKYEELHHLSVLFINLIYCNMHILID